MPTPSVSLSTRRPDLGGSFSEFSVEQNQQRFIGTQVLTVLDSAEQGGTFGKHTLASILQEPQTKRHSSGAYNEVEDEFTTENFSCEEHGLVRAVDDRDARRFGNFFDAELLAARRTRHRVAQSLEKRVADKVFDTAVWTGAALTTAVGTPWSTMASAKPVDDVRGAKIKVYQNSGQIANAVVMSWKTFTNVIDTDQVLDRIKYNGPLNPGAKLARDALANLFDVDHVLVGGGARNTAAKGATVSVGSIWNDDYCMVCRIAETPDDIEEPCIGRIIHWTADGSEIGGAVETFRDENVRGRKVRVRMDTHEKILMEECGHLLTGVE